MTFKHIILLLLLPVLCSPGTKAGGGVNAPKVPVGAQRLMTAYPDFVTGYKNNKLVLKDGTTLVWDDGRKKTFEQMLDDTDPEDMFATPYPAPGVKPTYLQDAGRGRSEALFKAMYGRSAADVQRHLVRVDWFGQRLWFSSRNGAADSLRAVARELKKHPELQKYLKSAGTFYWRKVRGAQRQSAHSYGIAIDIGGNAADYWKWRNPRARETDKITYQNRMPRKLVDIFRCHGFIWGGDWYHYDTMHFEFRPELLR